MSYWWLLVVIPMMSWGMSYLMTQEDGPLGIFVRIRTFSLCNQAKYKNFEDYQKCIARNSPDTAKHKTFVRLRNMFLNLIIGIFDCIYCNAPYASFIVMVLVAAKFNFTVSVYDFILLWGYSIAVSLLISLMVENKL